MHLLIFIYIYTSSTPTQHLLPKKSVRNFGRTQQGKRLQGTYHLGRFSITFRPIQVIPLARSRYTSSNRSQDMFMKYRHTSPDLQNVAHAVYMFVMCICY